MSASGEYPRAFRMQVTGRQPARYSPQKVLRGCLPVRCAQRVRRYRTQTVCPAGCISQQRLLSKYFVKGN